MDSYNQNDFKLIKINYFYTLNALVTQILNIFKKRDLKFVINLGQNINIFFWKAKKKTTCLK